MIASDRRLGGFSGEWGAAAPAVQRKRALLESEGVVFDADGRVSAACVLRELPAPAPEKRPRADGDAAPPAKRVRKAAEKILAKVSFLAESALRELGHQPHWS